MKKTVLSIMMLLMAAAVQAQRTQCVHRFIPYPEKASQDRAVTRANIGKPKTYEGSKRGLIILMEFSDCKFINKNKNGKTFDVHDFWNDIANKEKLRNVNGLLVNGSVRDFFVDQSYGKFAIDFDVRGPYTAKNKYAYYGRNITYSSGDYFDGKPYELIAEACQAADKDVNYKDYDWDDDGEVDQVYVIYAGYGEASKANEEDRIWPHASELIGWDIDLKLQGLVINSYACGNELDASDRIMGIGTICHEFSHCLGLPDIYDASTGKSAVGYYDIMDSGNYNGEGWYPAGYSAFERYFCGWLDPKPISGLNEVGEMDPLTSTPDAYIISPFEGSTNYWLVEKRAKASWDKFLPCFTENATGEAITEKQLCWYIDYDLEKWQRNRVNEDPNHLGVSIVDPEQVPTAILATERTDSRSDAWYDLQGRRLAAKPTLKGIYINNNKKTMIR